MTIPKRTSAWYDFTKLTPALQVIYHIGVKTGQCIDEFSHLENFQDVDNPHQKDSDEATAWAEGVEDGREYLNMWLESDF